MVHGGPAMATTKASSWTRKGIASNSPFRRAMKAVTYTYRIATSAKSETAFTYISDLTRHPEWNDHLHVTALTQGEIRVGSAYHSVGKTLYEDRHNDIRVTAYQPSTIFSFVARDPDFKDITHEFKISPQNEGSLVRSEEHT